MTLVSDPEALQDSLRRLQTHVLGRGDATRSATLAEASKRGVTSRGIHGFVPSMRVVKGRTTTEPVLRVIVDKKHTPAMLAKRSIRPLPKTVGGVPVDVVPRLNAMELAPPVAPGKMVKYALSQQYGSLTCVLRLKGSSWLVSASHVLAPGDISANAGDSELVGDAPLATLFAWDTLAVGTSVSSDVGVANTSLSPTTKWSDGKGFAGTRDYDPGNGPFSAFGVVTGVASGSGGDIRDDGLDIDVPNVGPVTYESIALLSCTTSAGDSGGPIRDGAGYLVGMIVGGTATGKTAITPWQVVGPAIEALVG